MATQSGEPVKTISLSNGTWTWVPAVHGGQGQWVRSDSDSSLNLSKPQLGIDKEIRSGRTVHSSGTQSQSSGNPLIDFSEKLNDLIDKIKSPISRKLIEMDMSPLFLHHNNLGISNIDVGQPWHFTITVADYKGDRKAKPMKIGAFIRYFFPDSFTAREIFNFSKEYNSLLVNGKSKYRNRDTKEYQSADELISIVDFENKEMDYSNVKSTFISLVTETYPHGHEEEVMKYLPSDLIKDKFGNYYKIIGTSSKTMFTSHLDTADRNKSEVVLYLTKKGGMEYISTDGNTILGADDKAGVAVMMYMIHHNIPGIYYFFIGEERGGIGSTQVAMEYDSFPHLSGMQRCVSFDRRNYISVITSQMGKQCCSAQFAEALCKEINKGGLKLSPDPTGIYTDSANFVDDIGECTNISVGYFNEHSGDEYQNITYLQMLAKACLSVNWEGLPSIRKVGFNEYLYQKYRSLIVDVKSGEFYSEIKIMSEFERAFIRLDFEDIDLDSAYEDLIKMRALLTKHKFNPDISFQESFIKIELR